MTGRAPSISPGAVTPDVSGWNKACFVLGRGLIRPVARIRICIFTLSRLNCIICAMWIQGDISGVLSKALPNSRSWYSRGQGDQERPRLSGSSFPMRACSITSWASRTGRQSCRTRRVGRNVSRKQLSSAEHPSHTRSQKRATLQPYQSVDSADCTIGSRTLSLRPRP